MIVCGIDPGLGSGAGAMFGKLHHSTPTKLLDTITIPTIGDGSAKRIDVVLLRIWIRKWNPNIAYVEDGQTMPGQASGSMGRYLRACGAIEAAVVLSGVEMVSVRPHVWKPLLGLRKATKRASIELSREWFPEHAATTFKLQKSHNLAEAALLAVYGASRCDMVKLRLEAA